MPGVAMVIHHGLQALSNAFLGDYDAHSYRILATDSQGQQDKTPQYTKAAYPCPSGPQYTDKDRIQTKGKRKNQFAYICVQTQNHHLYLYIMTFEAGAFNAAFYEFLL